MNRGSATKSEFASTIVAAARIRADKKENGREQGFARSHLACRVRVWSDRTIGERSLTTPRGLLAQLMELTTYCSDCAPAHAPCSAIYALNLSHHVLSLYGA